MLIYKVGSFFLSVKYLSFVPLICDTEYQVLNLAQDSIADLSIYYQTMGNL